MPKFLDHPYHDLTDGLWLRGNLHAHPLPADRPFDLISHYARLGYGFLGLTEHDKFYSFNDISDWNHHGIILIPGNEVSKGGPHILHVGANHRIEPYEDRQKVIDEINAGAGFAIVNHPNTGREFDNCSLELMQRWRGYLGLEIFNANGLRAAGSAYATDKWDILLSQARRLWGFASDDYHRPVDAGHGWVMAYVKARTREGILEALRQGRFYASTGVMIDHIKVDGLHVRIETYNAHRIAVLCDNGRGFAMVDAHVLEVHVPDDATYVRFECWGVGDRRAWTQPFWVVNED